MLQGRFASGRYTSTVLFVLSMLVILAAHWLPSAVPCAAQPVLLEGFLSRVVSALVYAFAAVLLSRQMFFDRAVKWLGALYLWFVAISTFVNGDLFIAFSSLLFLLSILLLFFCQYSANPVGPLYISFLLLGVLVFVMPYSLWLIPLFWIFGFFANVFSPKGVAASFLGLATPLWLLFGSAYVFPVADTLSERVMESLYLAFDIGLPEFSILFLLQLLFVLAVLLPALFSFVGSASPSKPLLRRRLSFVMVADIYLLLLFCIAGSGAHFFYMCQLPCAAVLASYLFAKKETKLSNVYFIFVNLILVAIATCPLWLMH